MIAERRKKNRISIDLIAYVEVLYRKLECQIMNISETGAAINLPKSAPVMMGNEIYIALNVPDDPLAHVLKGGSL